MALEIQNERIVGTVDNLQEKLNGELPINRLELIHLVNSWGRSQEFYTSENIIIHEFEATQCYDLSKLDTSEITDMEGLFEYSMFNGDISSWDVSNVIDMSAMFANAYKFNQSLNDWDVSKVTYMNETFRYASNFNQNIGNWDVSNVIDMNGMFEDAESFNQALDKWEVSNVTDMSAMFYNAIAFKKRFNNGNPLPEKTNELKIWFKSDRMLAIDIKEKEKDNLDSFYNNLKVSGINYKD